MHSIINRPKVVIMKVNDSNACIDSVNSSVRMKVSMVVRRSISVEFRRVVCS